VDTSPHEPSHAASTCTYTSLSPPCSDANACTTNDTCQNGACVGGPPLNCNDGNTCTDDSCNAASGCIHTNHSASCSDANACTTNDTCHTADCKGGAPPNCHDGDTS